MLPRNTIHANLFRLPWLIDLSSFVLPVARKLSHFKYICVTCGGLLAKLSDSWDDVLSIQAQHKSAPGIGNLVSIIWSIQIWTWSTLSLGQNPAEGFDYARGLNPSNLLAFDYISTPTIMEWVSWHPLTADWLRSQKSQQVYNSSKYVYYVFTTSSANGVHFRADSWYSW